MLDIRLRQNSDDFLTKKVRGKSSLEFAYRTSAFQSDPDAIILETELELKESSPEELKTAVNGIMSERRAKQPPWTPCAGSFFRNPPGTEPAGMLIDRLGLKGFSIGGAKVSEHHANFIVNAGGATCVDILNLAHMVAERVQEAYGIKLEREVRLVE